MNSLVDRARRADRSTGSKPATDRDEVHRALTPTPRFVSRGPQRDQSDMTKAMLLDCAEELFSKWGYAGVSIRDVTDRTQTRVASVNYYFGTKQNLYFEVIRRRAEPLAEARIAALKQVIASDLKDEARLEAIINAFVDPPLKFWSCGEPGWRNFFKLSGHVTFSSLWPHEIMTQFYNEPAAMLMKALAQLYPEAQPADHQAAALLLIGPYLFVLAETGRVETFENAHFSSSDLNYFGPLMKRFIIGGIREILCQRSDR